MTTTDLSVSWIQEIGQQQNEWDSYTSPLQDYTLLKVYNPKMWDKPNPELAGKILKLEDGNYVPFTEELKWAKLLRVTKCFQGYAPKLGDDNKPMRDENGNTITDFYFTPETSVYEKGNIAIAKSQEWQWPMVIGKWDFNSFINFTTKMEVNGKLNPLFDSIKTNLKWEKYPTSVMKPVTFLYFMIWEDKYKIRLGASYGNYREPASGTFVATEAEAMKDFKSHFPSTRYENFFSTFNWKIKYSGKFYYIEWEYAWITKEDMSPYIKLVNEAVQQYNADRFKWVNISHPREELPYQFTWLMLETSNKVDDILEPELEPIPDNKPTHPEKYWVDDLPF